MYNHNHNKITMKLTIIIFAILNIAAIESGFIGRITIPTGKVAVFYRNRMLMDELGTSSVEWYDPIFTEAQLVDINSQKDSIGAFQCVAKDDQVVTFPRIDVTNQLPKEHVLKVFSKFEKFYNNPPIPYDKPLIIDETVSFMKEVCTQMTGEQLRKEKYNDLNEMLFEHLSRFQENRIELGGKSTGIKILRVFIEIPTLDPKVEQNRREIAIQKTAKQAEEYRKQTVIAKKETENRLEEMEADKRRAVQNTLNIQMLEEEEAIAKKKKIQAESEANEIRTIADAKSYESLKRSQDNQALLTPEYIRKLQLESFGCQNKVYWGNDLPDMFLPMGNEKVM